MAVRAGGERGAGGAGVEGPHRRDAGVPAGGGDPAEQVHQDVGGGVGEHAHLAVGARLHDDVVGDGGVPLVVERSRPTAAAPRTAAR